MSTPEIVTTPVEVLDNLTHDRFELWASEPERTFVGFLGYPVSYTHLTLPTKA